jgi:peroxiredoxin-like protein
MSITHNYDVRLTWLSARLGLLSSPELEESIAVVTPPEFPGGMKGVWSPEHLFVASISSCLMTTFLAVAERSHLAFERFNCGASGKLEMVDGKYMMSEITLLPVVVVKSEADRGKAEKVLEKAEANCLISNSVKSKIIFEPRIEVEPAKQTA